MEPVALIVTALTAAATAILRGTAGEASKELYLGLKEAVRRCLGGRLQGQMALEQLGGDPNASEGVLRGELARAGAGVDDMVLDLAERLLAQLGPEGHDRPAGVDGHKYRVELSGHVHGVVVGDHAQVVQSFGVPPAG